MIPNAQERGLTLPVASSTACAMAIDMAVGMGIGAALVTVLGTLICGVAAGLAIGAAFGYASGVNSIRAQPSPDAGRVAKASRGSKVLSCN